MWFQKQIDQRTRASLVILEEQFASEHTSDTNEQRLEYLRSCSRELGHTPNIREVIGGRYIVERFGSWAAALVLADLELPQGMKLPSKNELEAARKRLVERD